MSYPIQMILFVKLPLSRHNCKAQDIENHWQVLGNELVSQLFKEENVNEQFSIIKYHKENLLVVSLNLKKYVNKQNTLPIIIERCILMPKVLLQYFKF